MYLNLKENKLPSYRINPINANEKILNENNKLKINQRMEKQYYKGNETNTILIYLLKYPYMKILQYFINDLNLNLYSKNYLFYLLERAD